ncbi:MAG: nucleoside kinase, partial [Muribaculaceae bacterium]|nr:nucleoside kinase [Muribaculaceae bacterium]
IYIKNQDLYVEAQGGCSPLSLLGDGAVSLPFRPICCRVNNKTEDLRFPLFAPKQVEYLSDLSESGRRVYTRALCFMLYKAVSEMLPGIQLRIEHSIFRGYFCRIFEVGSAHPCVLTPEQIHALQARMKELADADIPFERHERLTSDLLPMLRQQNLFSKVLLLETTGQLYTTYYTLEGLADSYYGALPPSTGYAPVFALHPYADGFILMGRDPQNPEQALVPERQTKMFKAFTDYMHFNEVVKVRDVGELNMSVRDRTVRDLINVAEAMHERQIGHIADEIVARGAKIVLLAGPSSSGKTTTCKRLAVQLMTSLVTPKMISLDDYFVDREVTPRDETGDYDYESLYALDLERLNSDLSRLLAGETVNLPTYSFEFGRRIEKEKPLRLEPSDVLIMEGIHGLNPNLITSIDASSVFKVYVSALTTLAIDDHNWISPNDNRLLRRIVRDYRYRHTSALDTIRRWPSVRRGEEKWIFPFQENADATFNSSLLFELGVMKEYAEPILRQVPHNVEEYANAYRLLKFLEYFDPIPVDQIPPTSLLREFLGGSSFHY